MSTSSNNNVPNQTERARSLYIHLGDTDDKPLLVSKTAFARPIRRNSHSSPTRGTFWKFHGVEEPMMNQQRQQHDEDDEVENVDPNEEDSKKSTLVSKNNNDQRQSSSSSVNHQKKSASASGSNRKQNLENDQHHQEYQENENNNKDDESNHDNNSIINHEATHAETGVGAVASEVGPDALEEVELRDRNEKIIASVKERRKRQLEERAAILAEREAAKKKMEEVQTLAGEVLEKLNSQERRRRDLLVAMSNTQWLHVVEIGRAAQISIALGERHVGRTIANSTAKRTTANHQHRSGLSKRVTSSSPKKRAVSSGKDTTNRSASNAARVTHS